MTPLDLLDALADELKPVLQDVGLLEEGEIHIYKQSPPQSKVDKDYSHFPYALFELGDGRDDDERATQDVVIVFGVHDKTRDYQGYRDVMNLITRTRLYLIEHPIIGKRFTVLRPIEWAAPQSNTEHPFYYGAMLLKFEIPQPLVSSDYI